MEAHPMEDEFLRRFDIARMVLERKHRWAKHTLRNLQPVRSAKHPTMAVDAYLRLYHGDLADTWTDKEFVGALWHEVNHLLRHHHERLGDLPGRLNCTTDTVLISSDLEINDDMKAQGITLPDGVFYSEQFEHTPGLSAEDHIFQFIDETPPQPDESGGEDSGGGEGNQPSPASGTNDADDEPDEDEDPDDDEGDEDSEEEGGGEAGSNQGPSGPELDDDHQGCGSGAGGEPLEDELGEPDSDEMGKLERANQKQAEDIVEAAEGGMPPGMSPDMVEAAVETIGKTEHDWRRTMATEIRNAMEQRADEAEEYSFRRQSRRAGAVGDDFILPGSYRPVPKLFVFADVSGSMDQNKLTASVREVHGILERLAIPSFIACGWNTEMTSRVEVASNADVDRVFEYRGGGTDMQRAVNYGVSQGAEVMVVLTDNDTRWDINGPGIPVILGGINRSDRSYGSDHPGNVPVWTRLVDVGEVNVHDEGDDDW